MDDIEREIEEEILREMGIDPEIDRKIKNLHKTVDEKLILLKNTPRNTSEFNKLSDEILKAQLEVLELIKTLK